MRIRAILSLNRTLELPKSTVSFIPDPFGGDYSWRHCSPAFMASVILRAFVLPSNFLFAREYVLCTSPGPCLGSPRAGRCPNQCYLELCLYLGGLCCLVRYCAVPPSLNGRGLSLTSIGLSSSSARNAKQIKALKVKKRSQSIRA